MGPHVQLLLADADAAHRSRIASRAWELVDELVVLEADDGPEALQLGLQHQPQLALVDVNMPRLGGIEVAVTLLGLRPWTRLALHTADPHVHLHRARQYGLPLFDKLDLEGASNWLSFHAESIVPPRSLRCAACGYGIVREQPLDRCPMCQADAAWIPEPRPAVDQLEASRADGVAGPSRTAIASATLQSERSKPRRN